MKLLGSLFTITGRDGEGAEASFTIALNPGHEIFAAHFPGEPILPGAVIVRTVTELAGIIADKSLTLREVTNAKFLSPINPEQTKELLVKMSLAGNLVKAEIHGGGKTCARLTMICE